MTPHAFRSQNCFSTASAIAPPIWGSVPVPNSSMRRSVLLLEAFIIRFIFSRCEEYVERSSSMLCSSPMSIMMVSKTPIVLFSFIGTLSPHCTIYCSSPTVFRHTDLPPALGPEMTSICPLGILLSPPTSDLSPLNIMSRGTISLFWRFKELRNRGWHACTQSICGWDSTSGSMALNSCANCVLACMKSISPRNFILSSMPSTSGRISSLTSDSIFIISRFSSASSSRNLLLASTTAVGSRKSVFPVADSSCTIPLILRFMLGGIGMTRRPSRIAGVTSFSMSPSCCAFRSMEFSVCDTEPAAFFNSPLIWKRALEAESFMWPYLSRICDILRAMFG